MTSILRTCVVTTVAIFTIGMGAPVCAQDGASGDSGPENTLLGESQALFQKLNRDDVAFYFETRAQQGFSVIHAAVYNVNPFVLPPLSNIYGDKPFINDDPRQPDITPGNSPDDSAE